MVSPPRLGPAMAQIGVAAAVAIPVLACVNAELIVFCKVSSDAPTVIFGSGRDVLVWTSGISVAHGKSKPLAGGMSAARYASKTLGEVCC